MTINELEDILNIRLEGGERTYGPIHEGNMCYYCGHTTCNYTITGEMYFGQEVGPNNIIYECPRFKRQTTRYEKGKLIKPEPNAFIMSSLAEELKSRNSECERNPILRYYSK